ncbi:acetolactate decarboxylase [Chitinophaga dinghuensis]|uniref:Alpha-acetolactate decarboxylase n=1 Tax=Chitinophaga dinghuensis TaxID=1539050 RepID=A0A327VZ20_9BACT|nr:acetolactate decarboxylase [Chitinophaga dinghuensis]RAJ82229.1 acetolactate decarboxylase [Chitinophaga dinghuensis]
MKTRLLLLFICLYVQVSAQQKEPNQLFTAGIASGLMGGLFDGFYPVGNLLKKGDFGLGAPDKIDGELLIFKGRAYQTTASGKTVRLPDSHRASFAMVNFYKPVSSIKINHTLSKEELFKLLDSLLPQQNNLYAIHISGKFQRIKTRAFPPVDQRPYPTLASMLPLQHFFQMQDISGDLIGYRLPPYMDNTNIAGYHFHFLSADQQQGGHIVDLSLSEVTISWQKLQSYTVQIPDNADFQHFDFHQNRADDIKAVEKGSKH